MPQAEVGTKLIFEDKVWELGAHTHNRACTGIDQPTLHAGKVYFEPKAPR